MPDATTVLDDHDPDAGATPMDDGDRRARPDRGLRSLALVLTLAALLTGISLFWLACETHYRACVEAVSVRSGGDQSTLGRFATRDALNDCTRAPF